MAKYKRKYFTPEEINEIKEMGAEQHLKSAYYSQYKLSTSKQMNDRLVELYSGLLDAKTLSSHWDCGHCSYTNFKIIGERYFQSVAYHEGCGHKGIKPTEDENQNAGEDTKQTTEEVQG